MDRRRFLKLAGSVPMVALAPELMSRVAWGATPAGADYRKLLLLIELKGGNDGLDTLVPYSNPTYYEEGVLHYCVANMPGAVPYTSTQALTNASLPYCIKLAGQGWKKACSDSMELKKGLNVIQGKVVYKAVADAFNLPFSDVKEF